MTLEATTDRHVICPACQATAKRVSAVTLRSLLKDRFAGEVGGGDRSCCASRGERCQPVTEDTGWRFCDSPDCEVVYFAEDGDAQYTRSQLKVPVGVKESTGERPLCYCFGHSVASIQEELRAKGRSAALEIIRARMKDPGCHCETSNPSGSCCLGSVAQGIQIARQELETDDSSETPPTAGLTSRRAGTFTRIGAVLSAMTASACCWLPLLLLAAGVSGVGIAAALEAYRPVFIVVTLGFLGAAFYFTYRPKQTGGCRVPEPTAGERCCPSDGHREPRIELNHVMLWGVTVLAVGFLIFPSDVALVFGTGQHAGVTENMSRTVLQIDGMTCAGCAATAAQAMGQVPGVSSAHVDYETGQAIVLGPACCPIPTEGILLALDQAGYRGTVASDE